MHIIIRINIPASGVGVRTVCFHAIKIGGKAQQILTIAGLAGEHGPDSIRSAIGQVAGVCLDAAHQGHQLVDVVGSRLTQEQLGGRSVVVVVLDVLDKGLGQGLAVFHRESILQIHNILIRLFGNGDAFHGRHAAAVSTIAGIGPGIEALVMAGQLGGGVVGGVVYIQQHHDPALAGAERAGKVIQFCNVGDVINVAVICGDCTSNVRILVQIILEIGQVTLIHHLAQIHKFPFRTVVHQVVCNRFASKNICLCKVGGGGGIDHLL